MKAKPLTQRGMGRPRNFSQDDALETAMRVFWEKGYEGASICDLTTSMGINRSSMYTIFGDKEALFYRAVQRYGDGPVSFVGDAMQEPTAHKAVEVLLQRSVDFYADPKHPRGCFSVQSALAVSTEAESVKQAMIEFRKAGEVVLTKRFERAQNEGEELGNQAPAALARYTLMLLNGLAVQSANGASKSELQMIGNMALKAFAILLNGS